MDAPRHVPEVCSEAAGAGPSAIRVILADAEPIYRLGIKKILAAEDDIRVMAQVASLPHLYEALTRHPTDVVLLTEQVLAETKGVVPELLIRAPQAKLVVQVSKRSEPATVELYLQGVRGVIFRSISADLLIKCFRKVADGETWIDNEAIGWILRASLTKLTAPVKHSHQPSLSPKQLAVVTCITKGMRNKEIAEQFGTTEQLIKNCLRSIYEKLGVSDRLELALYALHNQPLKQDLEKQEDQRAAL